MNALTKDESVSLAPTPPTEILRPFPAETSQALQSSVQDFGAFSSSHEELQFLLGGLCKLSPD